jgi:hypothetical protein
VKQSNLPKTLPDGGIEPAHTVEQLCVSACGYDLDEAELAADTCSDCGVPLNLKAKRGYPSHDSACDSGKRPVNAG